jgi:hypothetical protein
MNHFKFLAFSIITLFSLNIYCATENETINRRQIHQNFRIKDFSFPKEVKNASNLNQAKELALKSIEAYVDDLQTDYINQMHLTIPFSDPVHVSEMFEKNASAVSRIEELVSQQTEKMITDYAKTYYKDIAKLVLSPFYLVAQENQANLKEHEKKITSLLAENKQLTSDLSKLKFLVYAAMGLAGFAILFVLIQPKPKQTESKKK